MAAICRFYLPFHPPHATLASSYNLEPSHILWRNYSRWTDGVFIVRLAVHLIMFRQLNHFSFIHYVPKLQSTIIICNHDLLTILLPKFHIWNDHFLQQANCAYVFTLFLDLFPFLTLWMYKTIINNKVHSLFLKPWRKITDVCYAGNPSRMFWLSFF